MVKFPLGEMEKKAQILMVAVGESSLCKLNA